MKDDDALSQNPQVSRKALEAIHSQLYGWALTRCGFDRAAAEDLMQEAYIAVLSGAARFDNKSSLKTFVFSVVQNLARSRFRQMALRMRLVTTYAAGAEDEEEDYDIPIWAGVLPITTSIGSLEDDERLLSGIEPSDIVTAMQNRML